MPAGEPIIQLFTSDPSRSNSTAVPYTLTDHNRAPLSITYETIDQTKRMSDGTMRRFIVANKGKMSVDWSDVPAAGGYNFTADGHLGGAFLKSFYEENVYKPIWIKLNYAAESWHYANSQEPSNNYQSSNTTFTTTSQNTSTEFLSNIGYIGIQEITGGSAKALVITDAPHEITSGTPIVINKVNEIVNGVWDSSDSVTIDDFYMDTISKMKYSASSDPSSVLMYLPMTGSYTYDRGPQSLSLTIPNDLTEDGAFYYHSGSVDSFIVASSAIATSNANGLSISFWSYDDPAITDEIGTEFVVVNRYDHDQIVAYGGFEITTTRISNTQRVITFTVVPLEIGEESNSWTATSVSMILGTDKAFLSFDAIGNGGSTMEVSITNYSTGGEPERVTATAPGTYFEPSPLDLLINTSVYSGIKNQFLILTNGMNVDQGSLLFSMQPYIYTSSYDDKYLIFEYGVGNGYPHALLDKYSINNILNDNYVSLQMKSPVLIGANPFIRTGDILQIANYIPTVGGYVLNDVDLSVTSINVSGLISASTQGVDANGGMTGSEGTILIKGTSAGQVIYPATNATVSKVISSEIKRVFITDFKYNIKKRLTATDIVDMSIEFTEI